jgi:hypothetical protein
MANTCLPQGGCVISRPVPICFQRGQTQGFTLMSDLHIGSADTDYGLIERELSAAKAAGDRILLNGDVFDLIFPKDVKRFVPTALHPELRRRNDVLNAAVEMGERILGPYADSIDMIGCGNHETAIERYHAADPIRFLIDKLAAHHGKDHTIHHGGFTGFVDYRFRRPGGAGDEGRRFVFWYHHGAGAGAPVTKGTIDFHRKQWVRADVRWLGHKHNRLSFHDCEMTCPESGEQPRLRDVRNVMTGSYFSTYHGQSQKSIKENGRLASYAADAGLAPQGKGGARVLLTLRREGNEVRVVQ